ncbi:MAG TPA: dihydrolipoamide acetyltransferase family protein [Acidothermaceae bacterium]|jgi:pyruvate dehydrogenase E2 component (dihydrolipoamide acetyltransferase)
MPEVFMPRLSDTMQEGTVSAWTKNVGDRVEKGDVLAEIETDKATMELEAYDAGVLERIVVEAGQTVPIGEVIAVIGDGSGAGSGGGTGAAASPGAATPAAPAADAQPEPPVSAAPGTPTATPVAAAPSAAATPEVSAAADGSDRAVKASPLARAMARDAGLDLSTVRGSGPGGRIVRADVQDAIAALGQAGQAGQPAAAAAVAPSGPAVTGPAVTGPDVEEVPLNNVRRITAKRLTESMQQAPHFYLTRVVDADELVAARARINAGLAAVAGDGPPAKVSVNDMIVKAVATALRAHPEANVSFAGDKLLRHRRIHVGVAVALPEGLIVPVIRDADTLTLTQISAVTRDLSTRARAGKLKPEEFTGSTFSVSNLGMFGIDQFTAVINPPEAAILAVGATKQEPVVRDGAVVVGHTMRLTLSIDHRSLDGATAAKFLADLVGLLENPLAALA